MYGTVADAEIYFSERLETVDWDKSDLDRRVKALKQASRLIDRFNYIGSKTVATQEHEFPRDGDTDVPAEIEWACYEIAMYLLGGFNPDDEANAAMKQSFSFGQMRSQSNQIPEYRAHGIPSLTAWAYLKPYFRDPTVITLYRTN